MKREIIDHINQLLQSKISEAEKEIASLMESRNSDTKSSAGDKHETGRAMVQIELENQQRQLVKLRQSQRDLLSIEIEKDSKIIGLGSWVETNQGVYFISIGWGRIKLNDQEIFCISLASPIGRLLFQKRQGDQVEFQGKSIEILAVN